jgi:hypothetical protein
MLRSLLSLGSWSSPVTALLVVAATVTACAGTGDGGESSTADLTEENLCPAAPDADLQALAKIPAVAATCADVPLPDFGPVGSFTHYWPWLISYTPSIHRGRDAFYVVGEPQWALGKFSYGAEFDMTDEAVDVWVLRGCSGTWEKLGTTRTTDVKQHETVEGVEDDGARVYFRIPDDKKLPVGRHRIRMVVQGDHTAAEQFVEVLPKGTSLLVSDVDGTLTERLPGDLSMVCDEESDFPALWRALIGDVAQPKLHEGASQAYQALVGDGYRPMYLTARPEFLVDHTRSFLREKNRQDGRGDLPQGIVHTTLTLTGAFNAAAEAFKKTELARLEAKGLKIRFGFGNRPSDVATYDASGVPFRFFFENLDTVWRTCTAVGNVAEVPKPYPKFVAGDFRIKDYADVKAAVAAVTPVCPQK